jgi:hypothetical protein
MYGDKSRLIEYTASPLEINSYYDMAFNYIDAVNPYLFV